MFWVAAAGPVSFTIHASGLSTTDMAKQKKTHVDIIIIISSSNLI